MEINIQTSSTNETLTVHQGLPELLHLTTGTIKNRLAAGEPMPPSIKFGKQRIWLRATVLEWLKSIEENTDRN